MKKVLLFIVQVFLVGSINGMLSDPPKTIDRYKEIGIVYNQDLCRLYNTLTPQERIFLYHMFRASLPGNYIAADQLHRDSVEITRMLENVLDRKNDLVSHEVDLPGVAADKFIDDVTTYLVYLWTNHSQYFMKEHAQQKRTPGRLGLDALTQGNLTGLLQRLGYDDAQEKVKRLAPSLFDQETEPTLTVPDDIRSSAVNFYAPDFTNEDFQRLPAHEQSSVNGYYYVDQQAGQRIPKRMLCNVNDRYNRELTVSLHWLTKALEHAQKCPEQFDSHFVKSLEYLCEFIRTGDEELFKKHSIEWLKSNSKIDYSFGFIETYADPKSYRGLFQAEATVKSIDMQKINSVLPQLEARLPFPQKFKRDNLDDLSKIPNASINTKVFNMGFLGPLNIVMAYCLPNYEHIRSEHGSKQIIYAAEKNLGELVNSDLFHQLFSLKEQVAWAKQYDSEFELSKKILMLHVILHETLGHGSGKLDTHRFAEGDRLTIEGVTYKVGDETPVTSSNVKQFFAGYEQTIEELRAEIIALLSSIICYDELARVGLLDDWPKKINKEKIIELFILDMCTWGLHRLRSLPEGATEIAGDHARANTTILNYLIDHGGIELVEEQTEVDGKKYTVIGVCIKDMEKAIEAVRDLAIQVQTIKSTGDGQAAKKLIDTYGKPIRHPEHVKVMKDNFKAVVGDLKVSATLYPDFNPVIDAHGQIVDINASWPASIVDQYMKLRSLAYSTE